MDGGFAPVIASKTLFVAAEGLAVSLLLVLCQLPRALEWKYAPIATIGVLLSAVVVFSSFHCPRAEKSANRKWKLVPSNIWSVTTIVFLTALCGFVGAPANVAVVLVCINVVVGEFFCHESLGRPRLWRHSASLCCCFAGAILAAKPAFYSSGVERLYGAAGSSFAPAELVRVTGLAGGSLTGTPSAAVFYIVVSSCAFCFVCLFMGIVETDWLPDVFAFSVSMQSSLLGAMSPYFRDLLHDDILDGPLAASKETLVQTSGWLPFFAAVCCMVAVAAGHMGLGRGCPNQYAVVISAAVRIIFSCGIETVVCSRPPGNSCMIGGVLMIVSIALIANPSEELDTAASHAQPILCASLEEHAETLSQLWDLVQSTALPCILLTTDRHANGTLRERIVCANARWYELWEYDQSEVVGRAYSEIPGFQGELTSEASKMCLASLMISNECVAENLKVVNYTARSRMPIEVSLNVKLFKSVGRNIAFVCSATSSCRLTSTGTRVSLLQAPAGLELGEASVRNDGISEACLVARVMAKTCPSVFVGVGHSEFSPISPAVARQQTRERIVHANPSWFQLWGYQAQDVVGRAFSEIPGFQGPLTTEGSKLQLAALLLSQQDVVHNLSVVNYTGQCRRPLRVRLRVEIFRSSGHNVAFLCDVVHHELLSAAEVAADCAVQVGEEPEPEMEGNSRNAESSPVSAIDGLRRRVNP